MAVITLAKEEKGSNEQHWRVTERKKGRGTSAWKKISRGPDRVHWTARWAEGGLKTETNVRKLTKKCPFRT